MFHTAKDHLDSWGRYDAVPLVEADENDDRILLYAVGICLPIFSVNIDDTGARVDIRIRSMGKGIISVPIVDAHARITMNTNVSDSTWSR